MNVQHSARRNKKPYLEKVAIKAVESEYENAWLMYFTILFLEKIRIIKTCGM